ncbi:MAG: UDP-N-acetylmuramoyl-tripeptide--D-alanyl-D-alanine ligase, partial [Armatimonadota bacterium]
MLCFTLEDLATWCNGRVVGAHPRLRPTGVSTDTRRIQGGEVFFALEGEKADGHQYVGEALSRGAAAAVVRRDWGPREPDARLIVVDHTLKALGMAARGYRSLFDGPVVCVTGSSGKTTTKEMTALTLSRLGPVAKSIGNYNTEIGLPLSVFALGAEHWSAVFELAMRGPGQIRYLAQIAQPRVGVIVNVGIAHLELLGTEKAVAEAKAELLDELPNDGVAILPADSMWYDELVRRSRCRVISFGVSERADVRISEYSESADGCSFTVRVAGEKTGVTLCTPGEHFALDASAAVAAAWVLGVPVGEAAAALKEFAPPAMRGTVLRSATGFTVINDAYNANPDSMAAALRSLRVRSGSKVALLGCMAELGEDSEQHHRAVGALAARVGLKLLAVVGPCGAWIAPGAREAGMPEDAVIEFGDP